MSIVYRIDKEKGITFVLWDGVVTADQFLAQVRRLTSDANWPPSRRLHLADLRSAAVDASIDEAILEDAAKLYAMHPNKIARIRAAIVAEEAFKKSLIFEHFVSRFAADSGASVIVFNMIDGACRWLGIDANQAEQTLRELRAQSRGITNP